MFTVPNLSLLELGISAFKCEELSQLLQSAYQGRYDSVALKRALDQCQQSLSNPLKHIEPNDASWQAAKNQQHNYPLTNDIRIQLSDQDLNVVQQFSQRTRLDVKYVVVYLYNARLQIEQERKRLRESSFVGATSEHAYDEKKLCEYMKRAYFSDRKLRLKVLKELIVVYDHLMPKKVENSMATDEMELDYPKEVLAAIQSAAQSIFTGNVVSNLGEAITKQILRIISNADSFVDDEYQQELCECVAIFYAISQRILCNEADVKSMLAVFEAVLHHLRFARSARLRACCYVMALTMYQCLDPSGHSPYVDPRKQSTAGPNKLLQQTGVDVAMNTVTNQLRTDTAQRHRSQQYAASFLLLIIAVVYKIKNKVENKSDQFENKTKFAESALKHGALHGLHMDLLLNNTLFDEFAQCKQSLFITLGDCVIELNELFEQQTRDLFTHKKVSSSRPHALTTMLHLLSFLAHHSGHFCDMFVKNAAGQSFLEFLDHTADVPTPWFHLYAAFVYELACHESLAVYELITTQKCDKLSVDAIWQILEKTAQTFIPKQTMISPAAAAAHTTNLAAADDGLSNPYQRMLREQSMLNHSGMSTQFQLQQELVWQEVPPMTEQEECMVCAVLKLLEALAGIDAVQQQINYQHRPPGVIELLFRLLRCSLPSTVISSSIACIAAFVSSSPSTAETVWLLLERNEVLYTRRQKNQPIDRGIELDIIEGEKDGNEAVYPSTVSFCRLLRNLLLSADIPPTLGQGTRGQRPPGIAPYTDYVRDFVFLRWAKRGYKKGREQWEIAATSLEIFDALLDKLNMSELKATENIRYLFSIHPSFELLTLLLAPHSNVIEVILDIFQKAFEIVDGDTIQYGDDTMAFVRSALKNSLNLIRKAIQREESFLNVCQKHWPQRLSLRPLNTTLLSEQYREQIVSLAKCVELGNDPYVASYALCILSHLNQTQQGISLRSRLTDELCTLQNSFSSQLYNVAPAQIDQLPDIRVKIVQFLLSSLQSSPKHNLGLMLLAFSEQSAARDQLQSQISCLNAILTVSLEPQFCVESAAFAECCFELLYRLLANDTVGRRFLFAAEKKCNSYFVELLRRNIECTSNYQIMDEHTNMQEMATCFCFQRAWLLRAISFEFHLMQFDEDVRGCLGDRDVQYLGFVASEHADRTAVWQLFEQFEVPLAVETRIDSVGNIWGVHLEQFKLYTAQNDNASYTWNITKLNAVLQRAPGSMVVADKQFELQQICREALDHNNRVSLMNALGRAYDAWAELIRCVLSYRLLEHSVMNNELLLKLLDLILERLSSTVRGVMSGRIANTLSQVALTIMFFFRESLNEDFAVQIDVFGCKKILEGMVHSILVQRDVRNPRANLYSCLSNYFYYCRHKMPNVLSDVDEFKSINLNEKVTAEKDKLNANNVQTLMNCKEELLNILFTDSVSKDSYLSCVSSLVLQELVSWPDNGSSAVWLAMVLNKSRLLFVLKAACELDEAMQRALSTPRQCYFVYQFESMMDVLISSAMDRSGCVCLIENNAISQYLTQLKCLSSRVFWTAYSSSSQELDTFGLSMECSRFLQILTPCLRLMNAMFTACSQNVRLHFQALTFLQKHNDIIDRLLTLDSDALMVLQCVRLVLSVWYHLMCGPLCGGGGGGARAARDSSNQEYVHSKLTSFFFLFKQCKDRAFGNEELFPNALDTDADVMDDVSGIEYGDEHHARQMCARQILQTLLNIFRLQCICGSNPVSFRKLFDKDLSSHAPKSGDDAPHLLLLCDYVTALLVVSRQSGKWIFAQNEQLRRSTSNDTAAVLSQFQTTQPMISMVSIDVRLQCLLIENLLLLLFFHCEFYLRSMEPAFFDKFHAVVINDVIAKLKEWYEDQNCVLHVKQDMIEKKWSSQIEISKSSTTFIEIMIEKFQNLRRDYQRNMAIKNE